MKNDLISKIFKTITNALKRYITNVQILARIEARIDQELFLPAVSQEGYKYIESIKEQDIYDSFVEQCLAKSPYGIDVRSFVEKTCVELDNAGKRYVCNFFEAIRDIVFDELASGCASNDTKLILYSQDKLGQKLSQQIENNRSKSVEQNLPSTIVVVYSASMQGRKWYIVNYERAIIGYEIESIIDLSSSNDRYLPQDGDVYWDLEEKSLLFQFKNTVESFLCENRNYSIFGLAPIPLLIMLGHLFCGVAGVEIYHLHKDTSSWAWEESHSKLNISTSQPVWVENANEAILILSFSGKVNKTNISKTLDLNKYTIAELCIDEPYDDCIKSKEQLAECMTAFRKVKDLYSSNGVQKIHLFAAIPPSLAISIGMAYNENYDPTIVTYNYYRGKYTEVFTIGGNK